jgi:hypothetical protein
MFLMLFLPLQWSAAAVAQYCLHEPTSAAQQHVGHHDHEHEQKASQPADDGKAKTFDADCATCVAHLVHATSPCIGTVLPHADAPRFGAYFAFIPESLPDTLFRPPLALLA